MKVFLSWSGDTSLEVALIFRDWLPSVIQSLEPYVSSEDIDKGTRWSTDIAKELEQSSYGILCVTSDNIDAPWLNFEAGALSKAFDKSKVSPFLFNVKRSEIKSGPLLQFQSTIYSKQDVSKLITGINNALGDSALKDKRLAAVFDVWWPKLDEKLKKLSEIKPDSTSEIANRPQSPSNEILEELLELVRSQQRLLRSPEEFLPPGYFHYIAKELGIGKPIDIHPAALRDLRRALKKLHRLVFEAKESKKRTLPLKEIESVVEILERPIRYFVSENRNQTRRGLPFEDDDI